MQYCLVFVSTAHGFRIFNCQKLEAKGKTHLWHNQWCFNNRCYSKLDPNLYLLSAKKTCSNIFSLKKKYGVGIIFQLLHKQIQIGFKRRTQRQPNVAKTATILTFISIVIKHVGVASYLNENKDLGVVLLRQANIYKTLIYSVYEISYSIYLIFVHTKCYVKPRINNQI